MRTQPLSTWAAMAVAVVGFGRQTGMSQGGGKRWRHHAINREMQALGQRFGMRSSWLSLTFIVWDSAVSNYKKKCACPGMLPIQWILMDVTWNESSALLKCITSTVQCCVDLDFVFHWIHYLPKSDFCWMHSIFLTAVEFSFGRQITVNVRAAQNLCYNPICCIKVDLSH